MCIHEMLKEIDYWLKQSNGPSYGGMSMLAGMSSLRRGGSKQGNDLLNFGGDAGTDSQDE